MCKYVYINVYINPYAHIQAKSLRTTILSRRANMSGAMCIYRCVYINVYINPYAHIQAKSLRTTILPRFANMSGAMWSCVHDACVMWKLIHTDVLTDIYAHIYTYVHVYCIYIYIYTYTLI